MGSFNLSSKLISLLDSVNMVKELSHKDIFDLILDVLMGNVVFFEHELFLLEFEGNLVVSLSFVVVQQSIGGSIQQFPFLNLDMLDQTSQFDFLEAFTI